ncbi:sugar phosphate isomerase/epimerase [Myxococcota bacterium]|nr:sugar phosphate isomerase/epimerase [Myxococcota bacterium]
MLGPNHLVLCAGTLPYGIPFRERVEAAAAAGFSAITLWGPDYARARREGLSDADLRRLLADAGLAVGELDSVWTWAPGTDGIVVPDDENPDGYFSVGEEAIFRIADVVGARSITASPWAPKSSPHTCRSAGDRELGRVAEGFGAFCDRAARHGLLVQLEFLPWSLVPDLATAAEIVRLADRRNGGLVIDAWHLFRTTSDANVLRAVPGNRIIALQLADAPAGAEADLATATLHARRLPGEGELPLVELIRVLRELEAPAPIGVEIFSDDLHRLGAREAARRAAEATRKLLLTAGVRTAARSG